MNEIIDYFESIDPIQLLFNATLFTWGLTALWCLIGFFFKT